MVLIEDCILEVRFKIYHVQFNSLGKFYLNLCVQNTASDSEKLSPKIQLAVNDSEFTKTNSIRTDIVHQNKLDEQLHFSRNTFTWILPKSFCKNDANHDVHLLIEVFELRDARRTEGSRIGETRFGIYPRTNEPQVKLNVEHGEHMYHFGDTMALLRTQSRDPMELHAGKLLYEIGLREYIPRPVFTPEPYRERTPIYSVREPPPPAQPLPVEESEPDEKTISVAEESEPETIGPLSETSDPNELNLFLNNSPAPTRDAMSVAPDERSNLVGPFNHVSNAGEKEIFVKIHGAINVPRGKNDTVPQPYVVVRIADNENSLITQGVTEVSEEPTQSPYWDDFVHLVIPDNEEAKDNHISFIVADSNSRESVARYKFPIKNIQPFHEYHFELGQVNRSSENKCNLYASVRLISSNLPKTLLSTPYSGLEVTLLETEQAIAAIQFPLFATIRIVPDADKYIFEMLSRNPRPAGLRVTPLLFPKPIKSSFDVVDGGNQGFPQITQNGRPVKQPQWNSSFLFAPNKFMPTFFSSHSAVIIEYYSASSVMSQLSWSVHNPIGYSVLPLTETVYQKLQDAMVYGGLQVKSLPILGTSLKTNDGESPVVSLALRLSLTERIKPLVLTDVSTFPVLDSPSPIVIPHSKPNLAEPAPQTRENFPPWRPYIDGFPSGIMAVSKDETPKEPIQRDEMPPQNALETVLPDYEYIFKYPKDGGPMPYDNRGFPDRTTVAPGEFDDRAMRIIDQQMQDLDNYRRAVKKMSEDILKMRAQVAEKESSNHSLRRQMAMHEESSKALLNVSELEGISKADLIDRYIALRRKLASNASELKTYKDKVAILQNQVIKKNDKEKSFIQLQQAHTAQQALLIKYQEKSSKFRNLEDTVKAQEQVIEKMEKLMQQKGKTLKNADEQRQKVEEALKAENDRLRHELRRERETRKILEEREIQNKTPPPPVDVRRLMDLEKVLEDKEMRQNALQRALEENSRKWGRQKEELLRRIAELERGFGRSPIFGTESPVLQNGYRELHSPSYYKAKKWPHRLDPLLS